MNSNTNATDAVFFIVYNTGVYAGMPATNIDLNRIGINAAMFYSQEEAEAARTNAIADLDAAGNGATELARDIRNASVRTLSWFILQHSNLKTSLHSAIDRQGELAEAIEEYLKEGIEGNTELDEFIEQTQALAEVIGFEFTEEKTYTIAVTVSVKQKRGASLSTYDFEVAVESQTDEVEITEMEIDSVDEQ